MEEELDLVKRKNDLQQVALKVETYIAKTKNVKENNDKYLEMIISSPIPPVVEKDIKIEQ